MSLIKLHQLLEIGSDPQAVCFINIPFVSILLLGLLIWLYINGEESSLQ